MLSYILRRILGMIPVFFIISFITFVIIQLPAGDFVTTKLAQMAAAGDAGSAAKAEIMREYYGLNEPFIARYLS